MCCSPWQSLDARLASPISAGDDIIIIFSWSSLIGVVCSGVAATRLRPQPVALIINNHTGPPLLSHQYCMIVETSNQSVEQSVSNTLLYKIYLTYFIFQYFNSLYIIFVNLCCAYVRMHHISSSRLSHIDTA